MDLHWRRTMIQKTRDKKTLSILGKMRGEGVPKASFVPTPIGEDEYPEEDQIPNQLSTDVEDVELMAMDDKPKLPPLRKTKKKQSYLA